MHQLSCRLAVSITALCSLFLATSCAGGDVGAANTEEVSLGIEPTPDMPFLGTWKVSAHRGGAISAMTDEEADEWLGLELQLSPDLAMFRGESFGDPAYTSIWISREECAERWRVGPDEHGFGPGDIQIVMVHSGTGPVSHVTLVSQDRLMIDWDGEFFYLDRS